MIIIKSDQKNRKFDPSDYDYWVEQYIKESEKFGSPIPCGKVYHKPYNLPAPQWYIRNCPDKNVTSWVKFEDWCGFFIDSVVTKEKATELIYKMQESLDRPLMYDDFRGKGCYHVTIRVVNRFWGTMNDMKKELGLEIVQESMIDKMPTKEDIDKSLIAIKKYIDDNNMPFITTRELARHNDKWINPNTIRRYSQKFYGIEFVELLQENGIKIGEEGRGLRHEFEDGEITTSYYEYMFSKFLRTNDFIYNEDYFRDVKYSKFIDNYNGIMNCDYVIKINDEFVYIEIAGIIAYYKTWYYNNRVIEASNSKDEYRIKLNKKEQMLKDQKLKYFILFPCDLTKINFAKIITDPSLELKHEIEGYSKSYIKWNKIRNAGNLTHEDDHEIWDEYKTDYEKVV